MEEQKPRRKSQRRQQVATSQHLLTRSLPRNLKSQSRSPKRRVAQLHHLLPLLLPPPLRHHKRKSQRSPRKMQQRRKHGLRPPPNLQSRSRLARVKAYRAIEKSAEYVDA